MSQRSKRVNLSKLTDEEICDFMDSVHTDEEGCNFSSEDEGGDFSSEDDLNDPTYQPEEISPEDEQVMPECLQDFETSDVFLAEGVILSLNLSEFDLLSTLEKENVTAAKPIPSNSATPSTSTAPSTLKPPHKKRARSPLPSIIGPTFLPDSGGSAGSSIKSIAKDSEEFSKIVWRQKRMKLHVNEVTFRGSTSIPDHIKDLSTPLQIFFHFFSKEIIDVFVQVTNRCALSQDINTQFSVNIDDIWVTLQTMEF